MKALEMMKTHVQKIGPEATLAEAVDLMDLYQTSALSVVDEDGKLIGMLTERDVLDAVLRAGNPEAKIMRVRPFMTRPAVSIYELSDVLDAANLMLNSRYKRIPVVTDEGKVVGILNRVDVLQAIFEGTISNGFIDRK